MAVTSNMANRLLSECATNPLNSHFSPFGQFLKANPPLAREAYQYEGISLDFYGFDSIDKEMQSLNTGNVSHYAEKCKPLDAITDLMFNFGSSTNQGGRMHRLRMALDPSGVVGLFNAENMKDGLEDSIIHHEFCHGTFFFRQISKKENALFCPGCGSRITFPSDIRTPEQLDEHLHLIGAGTNPAVVAI